MAPCNQTSQRLLATLTRTVRYYKTRPTLLSSNRGRNYTEIAANTRSSATGFSIAFADGPLEEIVKTPMNVAASTSEEPGSLTGTSSRLRKAKAQETKFDPLPMDLKSSPRPTPSKKAKTKKGILRKATGDQGKATEAGQMKGLRSPGHAAWHETEPEIEELLEKNQEDEYLQKDYPDTRTIDNVGRAKHRTVVHKEAATEPSRENQRPLSTYKETWQVQKAVLKNKFAEGWNPRKKLSPDTMEGIRALHAQYPERYNTPVLAEQFAVSPEAIRRILKSKWSSNLEPEKAAEKKERWAKRHDRIWDIKSEIGLRPKRKGAKEVEDPEQFEEELRGRELLEAYRNA